MVRGLSERLNRSPNRFGHKRRIAADPDVRGGQSGEATSSIPDMSDLAARFARLTGEYDCRKRAATALVGRWDWYNWPGLDLRPLHFERDLLRLAAGWTPGRRSIGMYCASGSTPRAARW
ncbi:hypothetical protein ACLQ28_15405 [Micromonospora sp. DT201]|uniref:hypothetical protein n=1 Tax=Micromonospora sp. DT201 TaxID=3393442 RepID=UPI003CFA5763